MIKIAIYMTGKPNNGGSYQFWLSIIKALSELPREQYEVHLYSNNDNWMQVADGYSIVGKKISIYDNFWSKMANYMYEKVPCKLSLYFFKQFVPGVKEVSENMPDLWIAQVTDAVSNLYNIPVMIPIFDLMHRYERKFSEVKDKYEEREKLYKEQCKTAEIVIADSEVGKKQIFESYSDCRVGLEHHIAVLPFIPPDYIYHYHNIANVPYKLYSKYFFYPAQFWTHKNHINLIKAMYKLKKSGIETNLILVGSEQNNRNIVEHLIAQYDLRDNVEILGYVTNDEMVYLYKHACALIMPTFFGPTNIPQLEAFQLGCPVATSRIYGIPDQVGDAALLFDPDSVDEIADCMEKLWNNDEMCQMLIKRGQEKALQWGQKQFNMKFKTIIDSYFDNKRGK